MYTSHCRRSRSLKIERFGTSLFLYLCTHRQGTRRGSQKACGCSGDLGQESKNRTVFRRNISLQRGNSCFHRFSPQNRPQQNYDRRWEDCDHRLVQLHEECRGRECREPSGYLQCARACTEIHGQLERAFGAFGAV